jgi:hypothetical protein
VVSFEQQTWRHQPLHLHLQEHDNTFYFSVISDWGWKNKKMLALSSSGAVSSGSPLLMASRSLV